MVTLRKRKIRKRTYYYLAHTIKRGDRVEKKEKYLGSKIPKDIEKIRKEFLSSIFKEKWISKIDKIKENFSKEYKKMPDVSKQKYLENFAINFTYETNRIEGSKLTLRETADLLEQGIAPKGKSLDDIKEAESHRKVFFIVLNYKGNLNLETVLYWHELLLKDTKPEIAGKIRKHQIAIAGSKTEFPFPAELNFLLRDFFKWYDKSKDTINPFELAVLAHLKFVTIHPFADGNGRISRLIMNFILNKKNYPMLNIQYKNRSGYYTALERSQTKSLEHIFLLHATKQYIKQYRNYLK